WRDWPALRAAVLYVLGGLCAILPWSARNAFVIGDPVPIETTAYENLWWANHFSDARQYRNQRDVVASAPTPAARRSAALHFALRGIRRHPEMLAEKAWRQSWHFVRPEGLHGLLIAERSLEPWRHAGLLLLDDLPLLVALAGTVIF